MLLGVSVTLLTVNFNYFGWKKYFPGVPIWFLVIHCVAMIFVMFWTAFQIMAFLLLYNCEVSSLSQWCEGLMELVSLQKSSAVPYHVSSFIDALNEANDMFKPHLFHMCSGFLIAVICTLFRSISFAMGGYEVTAEQIIFIVSYVLFGAVQTFSLYNLIMKSHMLIDRVSNLIDAISKTEEEKTTDRILEKLKRFQGFSAMDFFTLNKPLLTSITANFVTYLIVLIQFRASETPTKTAR